MKPNRLTFSITLSVIAIGLTSTASAVSTNPNEPLTFAQSWRIEHDNLVRAFSRGLGIALPGDSTVVAASDSEPAVARTSTETRKFGRDHHDGDRTPEHRAKRTKAKQAGRTDRA